MNIYRDRHNVNTEYNDRDDDEHNRDQNVEKIVVFGYLIVLIGLGIFVNSYAFLKVNQVCLDVYLSKDTFYSKYYHRAKLKHIEHIIYY